ncbi:disulfide bond formation protein B [Bacillus cereus]|uniref:disulfide bond formation protein B n=1 Tax=Bacillus cereus TaxID=1396 RepID=UPI000BF4F156|nr:disulfide bond formation protein B [Bacillus cereus]PFQ63058.1 disulfide bond formation protein B [Bacillus cereus]UDV85464.1 disulfide bond formation protein B [Bacillus cereus]UDV91010.1 disulfide bond formation protein B [Bacillus cereus]UDW03915.1 disulfide bond formation protein B [Bacillus cereus]
MKSKIITRIQFLYVSFFISFLSIIGSLYFSEILGLKPCDLCWYQRIFMYPIPLIVLVSILTNDDKVKNYIRGFSLVGLLIAMYQYIIQLSHTKSSFCSIKSDCSTIQVEWFGFITLPLLSFFAFSIIFMFSFLINKE